MKKILTVILAAVMAVLPAIAQEAVPANEALGFIRYERNPARAGMAGAGAASGFAGGAFAAFGNPVSAIASPGAIEAGVSYARWTPQINPCNNIAAGASLRLGDGFAVSAGFANQKSGQLDLGGGNSFAPSDMLIAGGLAFSLGKFLSLGASVSYAKEQILSDYALSAVATDVMLQFRAAGLGLVAGVRSLGGGDITLPTSATVAASYGLDLGIVGLALSADADYYFSGNWSAAAGADVQVMKMVHARAGYRLSSEYAVIPSHLALGIGLNLSLLSLDVAYLTASETLDGTLMAGLSLAF